MIYLSNLGNDENFKHSRATAETASVTLLTYLTLPVRGFENLIADVRGQYNARADNKALMAELARMSDVEARANALAVKLSRLERILNVESGSGIPEEKVAARAVTEIDGPFVRSALLNVGVRHGISVGDAVMTPKGLYGHVIRVGNSSARVLKLEDLNSRVAVMSKETQARAILVGNNSPQPDLSFATTTQLWKDGDVVLTSGDDGILPVGLPIGIVDMKDNNKTVRLFYRQKFVDWVWVYPYKKIKAPEDDPATDQANKPLNPSNENDGGDNSTDITMETETDR